MDGQHRRLELTGSYAGMNMPLPRDPDRDFVPNAFENGVTRDPVGPREQKRIAANFGQHVRILVPPVKEAEVEEPEELETCKVCGKKLKRVNSFHLRTHDMTADQYKEFCEPTEEKPEETEVIEAEPDEWSTEDGPEVN